MRVQLKDGQIFHILTYGQNNMASYASQLSHATIDGEPILYVRRCRRDAGELGGEAAR